MKKAITVILAIILSLSLTACTNDSDSHSRLLLPQKMGNGFIYILH